MPELVIRVGPDRYACGMDEASVVSVLSAVVALASAVVAVLYRRPRPETRDVLVRYGGPLLETASALRGRLKQDASREARTYWLCAYLGQVEIIKRDVVYLNTGLWKRSKELLERLQDVYGALAEDPLFRLSGDEQQAMGELMIDPQRQPDGRQRVLGYAAFHRKLTEDPGFARWFQPLLNDRATDDAGEPQLDQTLAELINHLDPHGQRLPFERTGL
ncbi:hypothetical protein [Kibdelosporangium aridum]|uniref:hypothetical protein n=1 Tax=Kibdelosporangium aridum TaxID=2030 RepID=UPI0035E912AC